jgi:hypothetical protein
MTSPGAPRRSGGRQLPPWLAEPRLFGTPVTPSVTFRVPDFIDADGIECTDIVVIVEMNGDIRRTANLAETLQRPVKGNANE